LGGRAPDREPGSVLDAALTHFGNGKVFAAYLSRTRGSRAEHLTKEQTLRGAIWSQRNLYLEQLLATAPRLRAPLASGGPTPSRRMPHRTHPLRHVTAARPPLSGEFLAS
jgi:hypothetical protein